jgi:hypothetical protein
MKIKETREIQLKNWLTTNKVKEVGDVTADGRGIVTAINLGTDHGRFLIKVRPMEFDIDLGAGDGILRTYYFNNEIMTILENLHKVVIEHFNIDAIKEVYKGKRKSAQRTMFYHLFFELYYKDVSDSMVLLGSKLKHYTGLDRTSFNHNQKLHMQEAYKYDTRVVNEDYVCNHFYLLMEKLTGEDYSHMLKKKPVLKIERKSRFVEVLETQEKEIISKIEEGYDMKKLNDKFFNYPAHQTLYRRMKHHHADMFAEFQKFKPKRRAIKYNFSAIMKDNRLEIEEMIKEGLSLADVNDRFFDYNDDNTLYKKIRLESKSVYKCFTKHQSTRREYKKKLENGLSVSR